MNKKISYIRDGRAPVPEKEITSRIMSSIKAKNTKPEITLRKALWKKGIRGYRLHWKKIPGKPDIAFPSKRIAIFVNGCYWHRCPICRPKMPKSNTLFWLEKFNKNINRDLKKNKELKELGWTVITLWECKIKDNLGSCVLAIENILQSESTTEK